jgi:PAS domain S-box-containing protein
MRAEKKALTLERAEDDLRATREKLLAERKLLDATIACLPGFFFMVDEEGCYQRWNKNLENTLGYSSAELQGRDARDLVPSEDREKIRQATERGFKTGSFNLEYHNMHKDGTTIPYYAQGVATEIYGKPYLVGVEIDLTKLKNAERALRESEEHLRSLMETATNFAVYRIAFENGDPERAKVVFVSPSIKHILGVNEPNNLNNWFQNIHPEERKRIISAHFSLPRKTRVDEAMRVFDPNCRLWRWVQFLSTSVMDENGLLKYSNGIIFDINVRMELTEKLRRKEAELQKKTNKLAQMNTALQVLVEHREQEINDIETGILNTLDRLIIPYLDY